MKSKYRESVWRNEIKRIFALNVVVIFFREERKKKETEEKEAKEKEVKEKEAKEKEAKEKDKDK